MSTKERDARFLNTGGLCSFYFFIDLQRGGVGITRCGYKTAGLRPVSRGSESLLHLAFSPCTPKSYVVSLVGYRASIYTTTRNMTTCKIGNYTAIFANSTGKANFTSGNNAFVGCYANAKQLCICDVAGDCWETYGSRLAPGYQIMLLSYCDAAGCFAYGAPRCTSQSDATSGFVDTTSGARVTCAQAKTGLPGTNSPFIKLASVGCGKCDVYPSGALVPLPTAPKPTTTTKAAGRRSVQADGSSAHHTAALQ